MYILNDYPQTCFPFGPTIGSGDTLPNEVGGILQVSGWNVFTFPNEPNDNGEGEDFGYKIVLSPKNIEKRTFLKGWPRTSFDKTQIMSTKASACAGYWSDSNVAKFGYNPALCDDPPKYILKSPQIDDRLSPLVNKILEYYAGVSNSGCVLLHFQSTLTNTSIGIHLPSLGLWF